MRGYAIERVTTKVYDVPGREVNTLFNGYKQPGIYETEWNAGGLPSGIYFCRVASAAVNSKGAAFTKTMKNAAAQILSNEISNFHTKDKSLS